MIHFAYLVALFPLLGFFANGIGRNYFTKKTAGLIGNLSVFLSFLLSVALFFDLRSSDTKTFLIPLFEWIQTGSLTIPLRLQVDPLSVFMILMVTGIGSVIHFYSIGYMNSDKGFGKFYAYLNLFVFFMLVLVLASNYITMFIGWEGVGLCSYLLIGFWYTKSNYTAAAKKAFVMNRIGDLGFLIAILIMLQLFGSVEFFTVFSQATQMTSTNTNLFIITFLLFIGATGKSAQIPLFTWLPDAMAGPTPVSALIHAATMVTAGVYMIARSSVLFALAPLTLDIIAIVGTLTAILAATIAVVQTDIKKILAYSTISQLGYMFLGLGVGAYTSALYHVLTHAFFKALLFLGAGSVIHSMQGQQDIRFMGGLKKKIPITHITMLIGTHTIAGLPPFSGFFSKDEILNQAYAHHQWLWAAGFIAAILTSFYMFRMLFLVFLGNFRGDLDMDGSIHESPISMIIPLILLAALSACAGVLNFPEVFGGRQLLSNFLKPIFPSLMNTSTMINPLIEINLMLASVGGSLIAALVAYMRYVRYQHIPIINPKKHTKLVNLVRHQYYIDNVYSRLIAKPMDRLSIFLFRIIEVRGIDKLVNKFGDGTIRFGWGLRLLQTGSVSFYVLMMVMGIIAILTYAFHNV